MLIVQLSCPHFFLARLENMIFMAKQTLLCFFKNWKIKEVAQRRWIVLNQHHVLAQIPQKTMKSADVNVIFSLFLKYLFKATTS